MKANTGRQRLSSNQSSDNVITSVLRVTFSLVLVTGILLFSRD